MATNAKGGFRTKLYCDDGGGAGFVQIAEVGDVSGLAKEMGFDDATSNDSTGGFEEAVPTGVIAVGDLTFPCNLNDADASQAKLDAALEAGTKCNWRVVYPNGTRRRAFAGYVKSVDEGLPMRGKQIKNIVIKPTGPIARENHP